MDRHVFISYRRSDNVVVDELITALSGYDCWRDTTDIGGGVDWEDEIARAIDAAYAMILVVSGDTEKSSQVLVEYRLAKARAPKLPIVPLLITKCPVPFNLGNINARLWYEDRQRALRELRGDLDRCRNQSAPGGEVRDYLRALQAEALKAVGNYTPLAGEGRFRLERASHALRPVVMRPEFSLRRSRTLMGEGRAAEQKHDYEDLLPELHRAKRALILGEPGIGKTSTLYKFADELALRALESDRAPIPLIIPLREWRGEVTWEALIKKHLGKLAPQYEQLHASRRLYFLLDGLNELPRDDGRRAKLDALRRLLGAETPAVVTCRELDYRDEELKLDLDTITIHPLDPERVGDFLRLYLIDLLGENDGTALADELFWQIAGGADVKALSEKWHRAGLALNQFFRAAKIPEKVGGTFSERQLWSEVVKSPGNLMHLAANPYLLWMILNIYLEVGTMPPNRGALFDEFVFQLLKREGLAEDDKLRAKLEELAWVMQSRAVKSGETRGGVELTIRRSEAISVLAGEEWLYRAASANLLEDAKVVRFTHQLMQEYFTARRMLGEIGAGQLDAHELWPKERWWQPSGWEEAAVLAVGMSGKDAEKIVEWLQSANPEVAAMAMRRSGAELNDQFKIKFRPEWLPCITDVNRFPEARARAAIGRALGIVTLSSGAPLDNREGVGLTSDGLPDIEWIDISAGEVKLDNVDGVFPVQPFRIARYLVTNRQFQSFVDASDGYENDEWWRDSEKSPAPASSRWPEPNHPRESVTWSEAVAFCRWLTKRCRERNLLGINQEIRLPYEWEWQTAALARTGIAQEIYPGGSSWCNSRETGIGRTSAVGIFPNEYWLGGPLDMVGNLWERCMNKYEDPAAVPATDRNFCKQRTLRGGSWDDISFVMHGGFRCWSDEIFEFSSIGFRLAQGSVKPFFATL